MPEFINQFNMLDFGLAGLLAFCLIRGLFNGLVREVAGLVAVGAAFFLAGHYHRSVGAWLSGHWPSVQFNPIAVYLLTFVAVVILVFLLARLLHSAIKLTFTGWADTLLGGLAGVFKGFVLCAILIFVLESLFPGEAIFRNSVLAPYIKDLSVKIWDWLNIRMPLLKTV